LKSKFESNQIKNTGVIHQNFVQKVVNALFYIFSGKVFPLKFLNCLAPGSGSGLPIRIRIHNPDTKFRQYLFHLQIISGIFEPPQGKLSANERIPRAKLYTKFCIGCLNYRGA
jgi:hypothetical protein